MSVKRTAIALAAASLLTAAGSASVSAQEHCGSMYQRVINAYQMQSPQYGQMLDHYTARCLSGSSSQPTWSGDVPPPTARRLRQRPSGRLRQRLLASRLVIKRSPVVGR